MQINKEAIAAFTVKAANVLEQQGWDLDLICQVLNVELKEYRLPSGAGVLKKPRLYFEYKDTPSVDINFSLNVKEQLSKDLLDASYDLLRTSQTPKT